LSYLKDNILKPITQLTFSVDIMRKVDDKILSREQALELKIALMVHGIHINEEAINSITKDGKIPISLREYVTTSGIGLKFNENVYVNVEYNTPKNSQFNLVSSNKDDYYIVGRGFRVPVELIPVPKYHNLRNSKGDLFSTMAVTHTDRVRISPIEGCAFRCKFCDLPYRFKYRKKDVDDLIESINIAKYDDILPARHVLISGGHPKTSDNTYLDEIYKKVTQQVELPVDIMFSPRTEAGYLERLYDWGVNALSINIEIWSKDIAIKYIPNKHKMRREEYLSFLRQAIDIFGEGKVQSLLVVGLEPAEESLKGVKALSEIGCLPVLSPFASSPEIPLANHPRPNEKGLKYVYEESLMIVNECGLYLGPRCIPCHHNTLTYPETSGNYIYH